MTGVDPASAAPETHHRQLDHRGRPGDRPRSPRYGGHDGINDLARLAPGDVISKPCDCPCHTDPEFAFLSSDCQECNGTGTVEDTDTEVVAAPEAEVDAADCTQYNPCADPQVGCYVAPPGVDPPGPPCCDAPGLCGGPYQDCNC